jgi:DSBA-like thioredoxin domain
VRERLGVQDFDALIEAHDAKTKLRVATEAAIASGVFGVPTLALDNELFWGTDSMALARAYLANPRLFEDDEMRRVDRLPSGAARPRRAEATASS